MDRLNETGWTFTDWLTVRSAADIESAEMLLSALDGRSADSYQGYVDLIESVENCPGDFADLLTEWNAYASETGREFGSPVPDEPDVRPSDEEEHERSFADWIGDQPDTGDDVIAATLCHIRPGFGYDHFPVYLYLLGGYDIQPGDTEAAADLWDRYAADTGKKPADRSLLDEAVQPSLPQGSTDQGPFAAGVREYADAGWHGVTPIHRGTKVPFTGFTGHEGVLTTPEMYTRGAQDRRYASSNLALRLSRSNAGIDVDAYDEKPGAQTLREWEAELGPLPAAPLSTSRDDGVSGIRLFRIPEGVKLEGKPGPGIEIVQFHHRTVMAWPSVHPKTGATYRWEGCEGTVPRPDEVPELPAAWVEHLKKANQGDYGPGAGAAVEDFIEEHTEATHPDKLRHVLEKLRKEVDAGEARHDSMLRALGRAARGAAAGFYSAETAFDALEAEWESATDGEGRQGEFESMLSAMVAGVSPERVAEIQREQAEYDQRADNVMFEFDPGDQAKAVPEPEEAAASSEPEEAAASSEPEWMTDRARELLGVKGVREEVQRLLHREQAKEVFKAYADHQVTSKASGEMPGAQEEGAVDAFLAGMLTSAALDEIPPPQWLIKGWLTLDTLARINGEPGCGKSFQTLDWAAHIATGRQWNGHRTVKGGVVYLVAEGVGGFRKRVRAWEQHHKTKLPETIRFIPRPVQAMIPGQREANPEWDTLIAACARLKPSLIVLDTQARITVGVNENGADEMGVVVQQMERLRRETGACVLLVHHVPKGGETGRGSGAVTGALNSEFLMAKKARTEGRWRMSLENTKEKDSEDGATVALRMNVVDLPPDTDDPWGEPVTSVVLETDGVLAGARKYTVEDDIDLDQSPESVQKLMQVIEKVWEEGVVRKAEVKSLATKQNKKAPPLMSLATFNRAWKQLEEDMCRLEGEPTATGAPSKTQFRLLGAEAGVERKAVRDRRAAEAAEREAEGAA